MTGLALRFGVGRQLFARIRAGGDDLRDEAGHGPLAVLPDHEAEAEGLPGDNLCGKRVERDRGPAPGQCHARRQCQQRERT